MDNNKRKPKLVAEDPAACRRRQDGAAATCDNVVAASRWVDCGCPRRWRWADAAGEERQTWRPGYNRYVAANKCYHYWLRKSSGGNGICLKLSLAFITIHNGTGCKIRHGIGLQQVGPKPLIQAAVTGKCAKLSVALIIVCLDFALPLSLPHQHSALIRLVYGYVLAVGIG